MAIKSDTEIFALLGEWKRLRREGVTQKQFAADRGLSVRTLRSWESRFEPKPEPSEALIAKAQVLADELQRMIDALKQPTMPPSAQPARPQAPGWGSSHPDHRWFF